MHCVLTCTLTISNLGVLTRMHVPDNIYIRAQLHACTHACMHTQAHTHHTLTHTHTHTHTHFHTHTHTHTHTRSHTHTHTHTYVHIQCIYTHTLACLWTGWNTHCICTNHFVPDQTSGVGHSGNYTNCWRKPR